MAYHNEIGKIGEDIATNWCIRNNIAILERNYRKKYGEIDIVTRETDGKIHFIEVKAVSYETKIALKEAVSRETWRPEENVHVKKLHRLTNTIITWIDENKFNGKWQIDVFTVRIVPREKYAILQRIENIIIE